MAYAQTDSIANFSFRGTSDIDLGIALARCHRDYLLWHGQATAVAKFPRTARRAGVESVMAEEVSNGLELSESLGILKFTEGKTKSNEEIAAMIVDLQLPLVEHSSRIAAIVMLHNAFERNLWRLIRFAMVGNRSRAIERVAKKAITVQQLTEANADTLIDDAIEKSWREANDVPLPKKWDILISLMGYPQLLSRGKWHFDRKTIEEFDEVRHNCVHHEGSLLKAFDLDAFEAQLDRAHWGLIAAVAMLLQIKIPAEVAFGMENPPIAPT